VPVLGSVIEADINPTYEAEGLRFRIYRETLSRFSCAASILSLHFDVVCDSLKNLCVKRGTFLLFFSR
ncbi:hypothetical protein ACO1DI_19655, partial [Priestia sp. 40]|uniref:hypothetical protein n=1 Tax=Priestia sp. 40 TaxID=3394459 RepID=UPI003BF625B5